MRDAYIYTTPDARSIRISESVNEDDAIHVSGSGLHIGLDIPRAQRRHAAQALAGDEWRITSAKEDGGAQWPHEHESPAMAKLREIDPADVKVGDQVEVEADDGSWLVRGEVAAIDAYQRSHAFAVLLDGIKFVPHPPSITVRLVRRAEREPDPEQVEALAETLIDAGCGDDDNFSLARELIRRGVTVRGGDHA